MKRLGVLLLALASLTLATGVAEMILRWRHAREKAELLVGLEGAELCTEADPDLVYRYAPGRCGFNLRGFRDIDHAARPAPGITRFVVLGDSVAVGDGVAIEERFDRVLARRLGEAGLPAEAINLARTGYSTSQELFLLERDAFAYHPDLVIWSYVLNDPADPVFHDANGGLGAYYAEPDVHFWRGLVHLLREAREKLAELRCGDEFHALLHCAYADEVAANIRRIGAISRQHDVPTIFVIHPVFERDRGFADSSFAAIHAELGREARRAGLVVVDLLDAYRGHEPASLQRQSPHWFDPWHANARGHALAALALEPVVRRLAGPRDAPTRPDANAEGSGDEDESGDSGGEA